MIFSDFQEFEILVFLSEKTDNSAGNVNADLHISCKILNSAQNPKKNYFSSRDPLTATFQRFQVENSHFGGFVWNSFHFKMREKVCAQQPCRFRQLFGCRIWKKKVLVGWAPSTGTFFPPNFELFRKFSENLREKILNSLKTSRQRGRNKIILSFSDST